MIIEYQEKIERLENIVIEIADRVARLEKELDNLNTQLDNHRNSLDIAHKL
jgi:uncharacterized small protein (DUF1192 family)